MQAVSEAGIEILKPGRLSYGEGLRLQEQLRGERREGHIGDTVLLLEHPDVITFGRGARPGNSSPDDQLKAAGYEVYHVNRGGDVTWHGPGQLIGYPILDLEHRGADVHIYLRELEGVLIDTLADFRLNARRREGYAGVWMDENRKIASIGVGVRGWLTMHGFALNVCCNLSRFDAIIPCGLQGVQMTSMEVELGRSVRLAEVEERIEFHLRKCFA
ncbi:MAG: lipoyl(octanoyl) transferase LipB [bacterium]|nr:lipoyl(octanoyl) transferase LipB [bacterium]